MRGGPIALKKWVPLLQHPEDGKRVLREIKLLQFFDHPVLPDAMIPIDNARRRKAP